MLKALIFDFDGLILDTETPELRAWQRLYGEYGQTLALETWGQIVGGRADSRFDPLRYLEALTGQTFPAAAVTDRVRAWAWETLVQQDVLPGVRPLLAAARQAGLRLAVASSSEHAWVDGHLNRLALRDWFDVVVCAEDVPRVKPFPDLFLEAARRLDVQPAEAAVLEDSPNGVLAAQRAGIFVIAVPNAVTSGLQFNQPDRRLASLEELDLPELIASFERRGEDGC